MWWASLSPYFPLRLGHSTGARTPEWPPPPSVASHHGHPSHPLGPLVVNVVFPASCRARLHPKPWPLARDRANSDELRRRASLPAAAASLSCRRTSPMGHPGCPIASGRPWSDRGVPLRLVYHGPIDQVHHPVHGPAGATSVAASNQSMPRRATPSRLSHQLLSCT
jgi:hypothetical protein